MKRSDLLLSEEVRRNLLMLYVRATLFDVNAKFTPAADSIERKFTRSDFAQKAPGSDEVSPVVRKVKPCGTLALFRCEHAV